MSLELLSFTQISENFQGDFIKEISDLLKKGESVQIVGESGSGSSLLAKAISQNVKIRKKYFGDNFYFIRLDGKMLLEQNSLSMLRLLLSQFSNDVVTSDQVEIYRQIERKVFEICKLRHLVIILDHLDDINLKSLEAFYSNLYDLHRVFEPKLSFIFICKKEIKSRELLLNFGRLGSQIVQNIILSPRFNKKDSYWFIGEKEKQLKIKLSDVDKNKIFELSGGFPRTIKRLVESVLRGSKISELEANPLIDPSLSHHLSELSNYENFSIPILEIYKHFNEEDMSSETAGGINFSKRLTKNEMKVLKALTLTKGDVVDREVVIEKVWGERGIAISDHAYDQIIHRLRNKLKTATPNADIETVKGRGHVLRVFNT